MHFSDKRIQAAITVLLFLFLTVISAKIRGYEGDMKLWFEWSSYHFEHGLQNAYNSTTDYTPFYQYVLWLFGRLEGSVDNISYTIGYLRAFTFLADFAGLYLVYRWLDRKVDYVVILLLSVLNLAYSYNTVLWFQCDAILATFALAAFYFLYCGRMVLSGAMLVLMLNMKLQGIVLVPLWGVLAIEFLARTRRWKDVPYTLLAMVLLQALILLPFAFGDGGLALVWTKVSGLVGVLPRISMNAFNFWYLVLDTVAGRNDDQAAIAGLSFTQLGLILFFVSSFLAFIPLLSVTIRQVFRKRDTASGNVPSRSLIWLTAAVLVLLFFFFNTQMHERYTHPAFIFITAYAFHTRRFGLYALFSIAYFLNLERVLEWMHLYNYQTLMFNEQFIAGLYASCIVWGGILLYRSPRYESVGGSMGVGRKEEVAPDQVLLAYGDKNGGKVENNEFIP